VYLLENGFLHKDITETILRINRYILRQDLRRLEDLSFDTGLQGLIHYYNYGKTVLNDKNIPWFDELFVSDLTTMVDCLPIESNLLLDQILSGNKIICFNIVRSIIK
jgi:hypothetical protein